MPYAYWSSTTRDRVSDSYYLIYRGGDSIYVDGRHVVEVWELAPWRFTVSASQATTVWSRAHEYLANLSILSGTEYAVQATGDDYKVSVARVPTGDSVTFTVTPSDYRSPFAAEPVRSNPFSTTPVRRLTGYADASRCAYYMQTGDRCY